jgi:hypothetical protein
MDAIAVALDFTSEPSTEFSTRTWDDDLAMRNEVCQALYPLASWRQFEINWDAFDEHLCHGCIDGRLIVLRDLPAEPPRAAQIFLDLIGYRNRERGFPFFKSRPGARFALVLAGWKQTTIRVRTSETAVYRVHTLPVSPVSHELP